MEILRGKLLILLTAIAVGLTILSCLSAQVSWQYTLYRASIAGVLAFLGGMLLMLAIPRLLARFETGEMATQTEHGQEHSEQQAASTGLANGLAQQAAARRDINGKEDGPSATKESQAEATEEAPEFKPLVVEQLTRTDAGEN